LQNVLRQEPSDVTDFKSGPLVELDFWSKKDANLRVIAEQLRSDRVLKVVKVCSRHPLSTDSQPAHAPALF
jgi:hypothetical protein